LHEQAAGVERDTAAVRLEIQPVLFPNGSVPFPENGSIAVDADLTRAVERLHKLALANNDAVRAAFTTSTSSSVAVKSTAFWQALFKAEELARKIQRYQG